VSGHGAIAPLTREGRRTLPRLHSGSRRQRPDALARFVEPGRAAFELSLALCALSLVFPWLALGAGMAAARAWQRGAPRAWAALAVAGWCCFLGLAIRAFLGFGVFP
jgi:hypothetical protein